MRTRLGLWLLLLGCWISANPAQADITLEASDFVSQDEFNPGSATWEDTVTVPVALDRVLVVQVLMNAHAATSWANLDPNVRLNGVDLTLLFRLESNPGSDNSLFVYTLENPPAGTFTLAITGDDSSTPISTDDIFVAGGHVWSVWAGVDPTTPVEASGVTSVDLSPSGTTTSYSLSASAAGSVMVAAIVGAAGVITQDAGQTLLGTATYDFGRMSTAYKTALASGTVTVGWSTLTSTGYVKGALMLRAKDYSGTNCENTPGAAGCPPTGECGPTDVLLLPCNGVAATLQGVEALENKTLLASILLSPELNGTLSGDAFLDEDTLLSNSASKVASQQSIKAYVDAAAAATIGGTSGLESATTYWTCDLNQGSATYTALAHCRIPYAATIDKLYVDSDGGSMSLTDAANIRLYVNNVATALQCDVNSATSFIACVDTTNSVNVTAGDEVSWQMTETGTIGARFGVMARVRGR